MTAEIYSLVRAAVHCSRCDTRSRTALTTNGTDLVCMDCLKPLRPGDVER